MPVESNAEPRIYTSAFFCQDVIRETSDILTAIRITPAYNISPIILIDPDGNLPAHVSYPPLQLHAVLLFNSEQPTDFFVQIQAFDPDGVEFNPASSPIKCQTKGGAEGHALNLTVNLRSDKAGDCWMEVHINGQVVTKVPMRIVHGPPTFVMQQLADRLQSGQSQAPHSAASE